MFYWDILSLWSQIKHFTHSYERVKIKAIYSNCHYPAQDTSIWAKFWMLSLKSLFFFGLHLFNWFYCISHLCIFQFFWNFLIFYSYYPFIHQVSFYSHIYIVQSFKGTFLQIFALSLVNSQKVLRDLVITISYWSSPWGWFILSLNFKQSIKNPVSSYLDKILRIFKNKNNYLKAFIRKVVLWKFYFNRVYNIKWYNRPHSKLMLLGAILLS